MEKKCDFKDILCGFDLLLNLCLQAQVPAPPAYPLQSQESWS